jgi:prepilin peptidase CpaA
MLVIAEILLLAGLATLLCVAALGDIRSYRIPNRLNIAIAALALPYWYAHIVNQNAEKLLFALAFWLQPNTYLDMMMITSIAGGVLCFGILVRRRAQSALPNIGMDGEVVKSSFKQRIPYGVAIAVGGLVPTSQLILNALMR